MIHRGGPLLVLAGAGSGKTRVIAVRIAHLVETGTPPEHILALTFTNKAAGEMAERVAQLVGAAAAAEITVSTFHALGLRFVEEEARKLGLSRPITLIDASDQAVAVRQCLKRLRIDPRRHDPRLFLTGISRARNAGLSPDDLAKRSDSRYTAAVYAAYIEWLRANRAVDFDDLLLLPLQLLRADPEALARWRARFQAVLVDEYQDTNLVQFEFVRMLTDEHRHLCVVGDDDQSIYGWRGACIDNILQFESWFPDARAIALEQNYRSTGHILASANAVIALNSSRKEKRLWCDSGDGERARVVVCKDPVAEASFVAAEIHRAHTEEDRPYADFGVLFRASAQASAIEEAFRLAGIPYRLAGAFGFYERKEVKDVIAYLRLVHNPKDRSAFARIVNFPQRGIGPKRLEALLAFADTEHLSPLAACARAGEVSGISRAEAAALGELHAVIERARARFASNGADLAGVAEQLCEEVGARAAWIRDPTEGPGGHTRWRTVEALMGAIRRWQARARPGSDIGDWIQTTALDRREPEGGDVEDQVSLMTVHASKGLEWPVCFVIGCQEGAMPHQRTIDEGGDLSEERRLFYVAITRARTRLYLTWSRTRRTFHGREPARRTRFLDAIPADHIELIDRQHGGSEASKETNQARFAALLDRYGKR
ncbi:MAG: UvrD-helicase domain-containing protein [Deltaproteobacteria bacterium]|nr:UvrD-helicase domain-containing protein [Deltaproteobacteria bacterium]